MSVWVCLWMLDELQLNIFAMSVNVCLFLSAVYVCGCVEEGSSLPRHCPKPPARRASQLPSGLRELRSGRSGSRTAGRDDPGGVRRPPRVLVRQSTRTRQPEQRGRCGRNCLHFFQGTPAACRRGGYRTPARHAAFGRSGPGRHRPGTPRGELGGLSQNQHSPPIHTGPLD